MGSAMIPWLLSGGFMAAALAFTASLVLVQRAAPEAVAEAAKRPAELKLHTGGDQSHASDLRKQLTQAGFVHPQAARYLLYSKLALAAAGFVLGMILVRVVPQLQALSPVAQIGVLLVNAVLGYFIPVSIIDKRRKAYLKRIELALPDALDFMLICVEAGQSTDVAILRVAEDLAPVHPDLAAGFQSLTEALAAGANRQEAWMRMAQDTDNDDLRQLASIIVQSTTMGTPVAQTLRVFAADLRDRRIRKVEEKANVLPTKMTLGTMLFTVPPLLILLLAPAIYRISMSF